MARLIERLTGRGDEQRARIFTPLRPVGADGVDGDRRQQEALQAAALDGQVSDTVTAVLAEPGQLRADHGRYAAGGRRHEGENGVGAGRLAFLGEGEHPVQLVLGNTPRPGDLGCLRPVHATAERVAGCDLGPAQVTEP